MTESIPKRRGRFQFSLRTILAVVLVLSLALSWFAVKTQRIKRQKEAADAIQRQGGLVRYEWDVFTPYERSVIELREPSTFTRILRANLDAEFSDVVMAKLWKPEVRESDFGILEEFPNLRSLQITSQEDTPLTDIEVSHIGVLRELRVLMLTRTSITPTQTKQLQAALPNCSILVFAPLPAAASSPTSTSPRTPP